MQTRPLSTLPFTIMNILMAFAAPAADWTALNDDSNIGLGHFTFQSLSPGQLMRPSLSIASMPVSRGGSFSIGTSAQWGNVWNYKEDNFMVDAEWVRISAKAAYALHDNLELAIVLPVTTRTGGILDGLIEGFHNAVGLGNNQRDKFPRDAASISIKKQNGSSYTLEGGSSGISDIPLYLSFLLTGGDHNDPAVAVQIACSIPAGDETQLEGLGEWMFGTGILAYQRVEGSQLITMLGAGFSWTEAEELAGIQIEQIQISGMLALEYQFSSSLSAIVQYSVNSPVAKDYLSFSEPTHEMNIGIKAEVADNLMLEFSATENLFIFNNSADVGLHLALQKTF